MPVNGQEPPNTIAADWFDDDAVGLLSHVRRLKSTDDDSTTSKRSRDKFIENLRSTLALLDQSGGTGIRSCV